MLNNKLQSINIKKKKFLNKTRTGLLSFKNKRQKKNIIVLCVRKNAKINTQRQK